MRTTIERLRARKGDEEGFTLIELLIVIIILAILATIVIFAVGTTTKNAAVAACKSTVKTEQTAIEAFKATAGTYPTTLPMLTHKTAANTTGPWLREVSHATIVKNHYVITYPNPNAPTSTNPTGALYVATTGHAAAKATATPTPCTAA